MSRLLYLRVFNVRHYFIPRVLLAKTNISRDLPITNMNPASPIGVTMQNCSATIRRFGERTCQLSRREVQYSSELEQQSVSSMGSHVMRDSLHLLFVPLSVIYLPFFFHRKNLVYLQVGYKTFSYELFRQKAQYDSGALMGKNINTVDPP